MRVRRGWQWPHILLLSESFWESESLSEGADIESLSEGQERMAMATQIIVKQKLSGKQKS